MRWMTAIVVWLGCSGVAFGQEAPPDLPPIATSRFAVPASNFRDLRMLGEPAPAPISGETLHGDAIEAWTPGNRTVLIFWSPFVGGSWQEAMRLHTATEGREGVEAISIGLGPRDRVVAALSELGERHDTLPRTVIDPTGGWRKTFLEPLGLTELPAIVAIDEEGCFLYHGPASGTRLLMGSIIGGSFDPQKLLRDALEYGARTNVERIVATGRSQARRGEVDLENVLATLREAIDLDPLNTVFRVLEFDILLDDADRTEDASQVGRKILEAFPISPITLNEMAWHLVSFPDISNRDLDLALEASRRANAIRGWTDPGMLDTLARVHWMRGETDDAIRFQTLAVGYSPDTWFGDDARENLRVYTDGSVAPGEMPRPYRSPRSSR
jgi:hypothetical protein